jgi:hypothetical protein
MTEGLWSSLKAVELANPMGPTLAEVIDQARRGIQRCAARCIWFTPSCGTPAYQSRDPIKPNTQDAVGCLCDGGAGGLCAPGCAGVSAPRKLSTSVRQVDQGFVVSGRSSWGWLIQATVGSFGGAGGLVTNRSGWAA